MPFRIETWREGCLPAIQGIPDEDILHTQSCREFQFRGRNRKGEVFFCIYRQVVHERIVRIRTRSVAVCSKGRVCIIFSLTYISVCLPLDAGLEVALHFVPALVPAVLEGGCYIQFFGVGDLVREISKRELVCKEITFLLSMDRRLLGRESIELMISVEVVVEIDGGIQFKVGYP